MLEAKETEFYKAKAFYDHMRTIRLPAYYTVVNKQPHDRRPWGSRITIGRIFDTKGGISDRPVLFSQFLNSSSEVIVRSPISTVSVLEASAMAQEVLSHARLLQLTDTDFRMIEEREFSRNHLEFLYKRDVTEYSVCVHILANKLGLKDSLIAFSMCARLTRVVLNFPQIGFDRLAADCQVEDVLQIPKGHEFAQAIRDGLRARDLGTLYYLLCSALPVHVPETGKLFDGAIDVASAKLGIEVKRLTEEIEMEAKKLITSFSASPIVYILQLANAGYENLKRIDFSLAELQFNELNLPPVLLGDDSVTSLFYGKDNSLDKFDLEGCFFELDDGMSWVNRFSEGCV